MYPGCILRYSSFACTLISSSGTGRRTSVSTPACRPFPAPAIRLKSAYGITLISELRTTSNSVSTPTALTAGWLGMIQAERVGVPVHQRSVPDRGCPELAGERVHRIALVSVADEADEPGEVLRLVPVAPADQAAVRLRLAREAARTALVVVPDHQIERHGEPEPHRSQAELGVDHGRGVGALALDVGHRQAHERALCAAEQPRRRIPERPVARGCVGRRLALRLLRHGGGGDQDGGGEDARSHGRLQSEGAIRR